MLLQALDQIEPAIADLAVLAVFVARRVLEVPLPAFLGFETLVARFAGDRH